MIFVWNLYPTEPYSCYEDHEPLDATKSVSMFEITKFQASSNSELKTTCPLFSSQICDGTLETSRNVPIVPNLTSFSSSDLNRKIRSDRGNK